MEKSPPTPTVYVPLRDVNNDPRVLLSLAALPSADPFGFNVLAVIEYADALAANVYVPNVTVCVPFTGMLTVGLACVCATLFTDQLIETLVIGAAP